MTTARDIEQNLFELAPGSYAMEWDNVGLLVGHGDRSVRRVLLALDADDAAVAEAVEEGYDLLITHHPLIYKPLYHLTGANGPERRVEALLCGNVALISMHTNLDAAHGGVNDALAEALGLTDVEEFLNEDAREGVPSIGRVGTVEEMSPAVFLEQACRALDTNGGRHYLCRRVHRVAVGGGGCADYLADAYRAGCDTFLTADCKYHNFTLAADLGINLIDLGHYATEYVVLPKLKSRLEKAFPEVEFTLSSRECDVVGVVAPLKKG